MNFPGLQLFYHPSRAVNDALEKPSYTFAIVLILIPSIVGILTGFLNGFAFQPTATVLNIVGNILTWIIGAIIFYVGYSIVRREKFNVGFSGIASAFSLIWAGLAVVSILVLISTFFVSPALKSVLAASANDNLSGPETFSLVNALADNDSRELSRLMDEYNMSTEGKNRVATAYTGSRDELFNVIPLAIILVISVVFFVFSIAIVPYVIVRETFSWGPILNIFLLILLGFIAFSAITFANSLIPAF